MTIPSTSLPSSFRKVTLTLAREPSHPSGDMADRYTLVVPLTELGFVDEIAVQENPLACRVLRDVGGERAIGHLAREEGSVWRTIFDVEADLPDETWFRLADECLVAGEYISLSRDDGEHTFRVLMVSEL